jgi:hypothetical protein
LKTHPRITSDQIYICFIGDRSIDDKDFGKIVKDRKKEMVEYIDILNKADLKDYQNMALLLTIILLVLVLSQLILF